MSWLSPRAMERRPGTPGRIIILVDATGSVSPVNKARISKEVDGILMRERGARVLAFGTAVVDITSDPSAIKRMIWGCFPGLSDEHDWRKSGAIQGTYIGRALAAAAQASPERTIILSDGGAVDKADAFRAADGMTGVIDAYYCHPLREEYDLEHHFISANELWRHYSRGADRSVMQELARRGGGTFEVYPTRAGVYSDYGIREGHSMRQRMPGGNVYINGPGAQRHVVYEDHYITRQRRFFYEDAPDEHINAQPPQDVHIDMEPTQVQYQQGQAIEHHHAPSFWNWMIKGAPNPPPTALPTPQRGNEEYRGIAQSIPARSSAPALPGPAQSPNDATNQGRRAFHAGAHPPHNPYPPSDGRHGAWLQGWVDESRKRGALPNHSGQGLIVATGPRQRMR